MSAIDAVMADIGKAARLIEPAFAVIAIAQHVTGLGGEVTAEALEALDAALKLLESAAMGAITSEQAMGELAALKAGLRSDDDTADAALAARFASKE